MTWPVQRREGRIIITLPEQARKKLARLVAAEQAARSVLESYLAACLAFAGLEEGRIAAINVEEGLIAVEEPAGSTLHPAHVTSTGLESAGVVR